MTKQKSDSGEAPSPYFDRLGDLCPFRHKISVLKISVDDPREKTVSDQTRARAEQVSKIILEGTFQNLCDLVDQTFERLSTGPITRACPGYQSWRHLVSMVAAHNSGVLALRLLDYIQAKNELDANIGFTDFEVINSVLFFSHFNTENLKEVLPPPDQHIKLFADLFTSFLFKNELVDVLDLCQNPKMEKDIFEILSDCHSLSQLTPQSQKIFPKWSGNGLLANDSESEDLVEFLQILKSRIQLRELAATADKQCCNLSKVSKKM